MPFHLLKFTAMKLNSSDYRNMHNEVNRVKTDKHSPNVLVNILYGGKILHRNVKRDVAYGIIGKLKQDSNYKSQKFEVKEV